MTDKPVEPAEAVGDGPDLDFDDGLDFTDRWDQGPPEPDEGQDTEDALTPDLDEPEKAVPDGGE